MSNKAYFISFTALLFLFLTDCVKEKKTERDYPQIRTLAVDQITLEGARFNAAIVSGDPETITEYGFVWGRYDVLTIQNSEKVTMDAPPEKDEFSINVTSSLEDMKEYYVRSYIKAGELVIYGDAVKFTSLGSMAPEITDFEPKSATWGDTITIFGTNFSGNQSNKVLFDEVGSPFVIFKNNTLKAVVPYNLTKTTSHISVEVMGNRTTSTEVFNLFSPVKITAISPLEVAWLDTMVISGEFPPDIALTVYIDNINCPIRYKHNNELGIVIPESLLSYDNPLLSVKFNSHTLVSNITFKLKKPFIDSNNVLSGDPGDEITLTGYFNPLPANNSVEFGNRKASIVQCSKNSLKFSVPEIFNTFSETVTVTSGSMEIMNKPFNYTLPKIISSSPKSGSQYESVTIIGKGFIEDKSIVYLDDYRLFITSLSSTEIKASLPTTIPNGLYTFKLKVLDQNINSSETYEVKRPRIIDFNPKEASYGDVITIQVENFPNDVWATLNNGDPLEIVSHTATEIKARLPQNIPLISNTIYVCNELASDFLILKKPEIKYYPEITSTRNKNLVIESKYTSSWVGAYEVKIGDIYTRVENITPTSFEIVIPLLPAGEYPVSLKIADYTFDITDHFILQDTWSAYSDIPSGINTATHYPASFIIGNKIHVVTGTLNGDLTNSSCSFDFQTKTWQNIASFTGNERVLATGWAINTTGYVGFGHASYIGDDRSDVYKYDSQSDTWSPINHSFPGNPRRSPFAVTIGGKAYVGGGTSNGESFKDFYEFDPVNDTWSRKSDIPDYTLGINAIAVNNIIYSQANHSLFKYDPESDSWTTETIQSEVSTYIYPAFAIGGKIYYSTRDENPAIYWTYDINTSTWQRISDCIYPANFGISFSYQGHGFTGLGYDRTIYMYDPTLEP